MVYRNASRASCLLLKKDTQFTATSQFMAKSQDGKAYLVIIPLFTGHGKTIYEEVLLSGFKELIAEVGGLLGLFLGFSIFDYFCKLIDKLISNTT